jgi:hypothetical protein
LDVTILVPVVAVRNTKPVTGKMKYNKEFGFLWAGRPKPEDRSEKMSKVLKSDICKGEIFL